MNDQNSGLGNRNAILAIMGSIVISTVLSNTAKMPDDVGLGIFIFWFYPALVGLATIIIYFAAMWFTKKWRIFVVTFLCIANVYFGCLLHRNLL